MNQAMILALTTPGVMLLCMALAIALIEAERRWTARRRSHMHAPGTLAYVLDGLALVFVGLAIANFVTTILPILGRLPTTIAPLLANRSALPLVVGGVLIGVLLLAGIFGRRIRRQRQVAAAPLEPVPLTPVANSAHPSNTEATAFMVPVYQGGRITAMVPAPPPSFLDMPLPKQEPQPIELQRNVRQVGFIAIMSLGLAITAIILVISSNAQFQQQTDSFMSELRAQIARQAEQTTLFNSAVREANQPIIVIVPSAVPVPTAQPEPAAAQPVYERKRVSSDILNLRAAPGGDQPILARLQRGTEVELIGQSQPIEADMWVRIRIGSAEGWVSSAFLE